MSRRPRFGVTGSSVAGQTMQLVGSEDALTVRDLQLFSSTFFFNKIPKLLNLRYKKDNQPTLSEYVIFFLTFLS